MKKLFASKAGVLALVSVLVCGFVFVPAICTDENLASAEDLVLLKGDMDNDGVITAADARLVLRTSVGLEDVQFITPEDFGATQTSPEQTTAAAGVTPEATTVPESAEKDPSVWTTAEILEYVTKAVTKTKAYTAVVTVDHTENYDVSITEAPGGSLVMNITDSLIASIAKPSQETLTFRGGRTINSEGENIPLLLPERGDFALTSSGVASASAKKSGSDVQISIRLVKETGTLTTVPKHNAASVGYLDISSMDLVLVTINSIDTDYIGSTLDVVINEDGYVANAVYKIPVEIACSCNAMGTTANIECVGKKSETWKINW